jgi:hypothetical protein
VLCTGLQSVENGLQNGEKYLNYASRHLGQEKFFTLIKVQNRDANSSYLTLGPAVQWFA